MIQPEYRVWNRPILSHPSLEAFLSVRQMEDGIHSIALDGHLLDFLFQKKPSDSLMVVFGGAAPRVNGNKAPFFSGIELSNNVNCSLMAINDPSFYLDPQINLAWYAGSRGLPLQSILPAVIDKVASTCASFTIMTGGSAGGFAGLYYATRTTSPCVAVVYNPQTNIIRYYPRSVERFARVCFDWHQGDVESAFREITYDLTKHYLQEKAPVVYLQNCSDYRHITTHAIPFLKAYGLKWTGADLSAEDICVHAGYWGSGHKPPPRDLIAHVINQLCDPKTSLSTVGNLPDHLSHRRPFVVHSLQHFLPYCAAVMDPVQRFSRHHPSVVPLARLAVRLASAPKLIMQWRSRRTPRLRSTTRPG